MSFITLSLSLLLLPLFCNSGLKVLIQEGFQPIVELHVTRGLSTRILGRHLAAGLAAQPVIRVVPVTAVVPLSEHFQFLSFGVIAEGEVLV